MVHLVYVQFTGLGYSSDGSRNTPLFRGYSGAGSHKNNPKSQCVSDLGPIPVGWYSMTLLDEHLGMKNVIRLVPDPSNNMCGRGGFLIHGDSISEPGTASQGCIIVNDAEKRKSLAAAFNRLHVIAADSPLFSPEVLAEPEIFTNFMRSKGGSGATFLNVDDSKDMSRFQLPHFLGSGYRTYAGTIGARIVNHDAIVSAPVPWDARVESQLGLLLRREDLETALAADVSIGGSYGALSGKAKASLRKQFNSSQTSVYLAFTKKVVTGIYRLAQYPVLESAAKEAASPNDFLLAYGDSLITGVGLGGAICYIFKFDFSTETEATSFKASVSARYGTVNGSASVSMREKIEKIETSIEFYGYTTGIVSAPQLFEGLDKKDLGLFNGKIGRTALANLFSYFDDFQNLFTQDDDLTGYSQCEIEMQDLRTLPEILDNQREIGKLGESAARIADELASQGNHLDAVIAQLSYVASVPDFGDDQSVAVANEFIGACESLAIAIDDRMDALVLNLDLESSASFAGQIPQIPSYLCTADPTVEERRFHAPRGREVFFDFPYNPALGEASCFVEAIGSVWTVRHRPNGAVMKVKIIELQGDFRVPHSMDEIGAGKVVDEASGHISRGSATHPKPKGILFRPSNQKTFYAAGVYVAGDYRSEASLTLRVKTSRQSPPDMI